MRLITVGVEGKTTDDLERLVKERGIDRIVDVRLTPGSRGGDLSWRPEELNQRFQGRYIWIPELGCKTLRASLRKGEKPAFRDLDKGLHTLGRSVLAFQSHTTLLFIGEPGPPDECGRKTIVEGLAAELTDVGVIHVLPDAPPPEQGALL